VAKVFFLAFMGALAAGLGATVFFELRGAASWGSRRLIKIAVSLLPESIRDEHEEIWLADIDYWKDGALGRLLWTVGLLVAAARIGRRERKSALAEESPQQVKSSIPDQMIPRLTQHEWVLTGLASEGLTNEHIAARLGVSVGIVETDLLRAYAKLGISSRRGLRAELSAED
jgi:DNA-binding CsgD family transcriptional regulator